MSDYSKRRFTWSGTHSALDESHDSTLDFKSRWFRANSPVERAVIDALFVMKPAILAYLTGAGRPCALRLLPREPRCIVAVPASDLSSMRKTSAATDIRMFRSEP